MRTQKSWTYARTRVIENPQEAEKYFRILVMRIEQATGAFLNYSKDYRDSSPLGFQSDRAKWSPHTEPKPVSFEATYVRCPLPLFQLPSGARPFVIDTLAGGHSARGSTEFPSAKDPRLAAIFEVAVMQRFESLLQQSWSTTDKEAILSWSTGLNFEKENDEELKTEHNIDFFFNPTYSPQPHDFEKMLSEAGLPLGDSDRTNRPLTDRATWRVVSRIRKEEIVSVVRALDHLMRTREGWTPESPLTLSVYERIRSVERIRNGRSFDDLAAEFNRVSRDWNIEFNAFYHSDFDPFADPEIIPEESGEIRLPIGKLKRGSLYFDLVHIAAGTFLEIRTAQSSSSAKKLAKDLDLKLEFWEGEPSGRWLGATSFDVK